MPVTRVDIEAAIGRCDEAAVVGSPSGTAECWRVVQGGNVTACKVITHASQAERFEREVEGLQRVDCPRVVKVLGRGELTQADNGNIYPYLRSEFVPGGDVRANLIANGPPDDAELRAFIKGTIEGLIEMHAADVVHRDLKPENIILRGGSWAEPVIIDLGLSRLVDLTTVTVYPWEGGTWPYMAPEQLRGERAIDRSDIWALAVIASELARGQHPWLQGEQVKPSDWDTRLRTGVSVPGHRPAGLRDWLTLAGDYAGYRRPSAQQAQQALEKLWP